MLLAVASLNLETFTSNKIKVFSKCAERVAGGAPPRHCPRKSSAAAMFTKYAALYGSPARAATIRVATHLRGGGIAHGNAAPQHPAQANPAQKPVRPWQPLHHAHHLEFAQVVDPIHSSLSFEATINTRLWQNILIKFSGRF